MIKVQSLAPGAGILYYSSSQRILVKLSKMTKFLGKTPKTTNLYFLDQLLQTIHNRVREHYERVKLSGAKIIGKCQVI